MFSLLSGNWIFCLVSSAKLKWEPNGKTWTLIRNYGNNQLCCMSKNFHGLGKNVVTIYGWTVIRVEFSWATVFRYSLAPISSPWVFMIWKVLFHNPFHRLILDLRILSDQSAFLWCILQKCILPFSVSLWSTHSWLSNGLACST